MIYLDNAATTRPLPEVIDAMMSYLTDKWYNPSSSLLSKREKATLCHLYETPAINEDYTW